MSSGTKIQWTDFTWNPVTGCTRASAGCDNCYAVKQSHRNGAMGQAKYAGLTVLNKAGDRHFNGIVRTHDDALTIPLKWQRRAKRFIAKHGRRMRVFVNSMSDLYHKDVPLDFIDRVKAVEALCPDIDFLELTKRPQRMAEYLASTSKMKIGDSVRCDIAWNMTSIGFDARLSGDYADQAGQLDCGNLWPLPNVWLGTSCENQQAADERIPHLLRCPAAVRFLSCEPLLGPINLTVKYANIGAIHNMNPLRGYGGWGDLDRDKYKVHWVIAGGESGPNSRPCQLDWIRSIVQQCKAAGTACFVKQLGAKPVQFGECDCGRVEHGRCHQSCPSINPQPIKLSNKKGGDPSEWPADLRVREFPAQKAEAGR